MMCRCRAGHKRNVWMILQYLEKIRPGMQIAVTMGSRGIRNSDIIVKVNCRLCEILHGNGFTLELAGLKHFRQKISAKEKGFSPCPLPSYGRTGKVIRSSNLSSAGSDNGKAHSNRFFFWMTCDKVPGRMTRKGKNKPDAFVGQA